MTLFPLDLASSLVSPLEWGFRIDLDALFLCFHHDFSLIGRRPNVSHLIEQLFIEHVLGFTHFCFVPVPCRQRRLWKRHLSTESKVFFPLWSPHRFWTPSRLYVALSGALITQFFIALNSAKSKIIESPRKRSHSRTYSPQFVVQTTAGPDSEPNLIPVRSCVHQKSLLSLCMSRCKFIFILSNYAFRHRLVRSHESH